MRGLQRPPPLPSSPFQCYGLCVHVKNAFSIKFCQVGWVSYFAILFLKLFSNLITSFQSFPAIFSLDCLSKILQKLHLEQGYTRKEILMQYSKKFLFKELPLKISKTFWTSVLSYRGCQTNLLISQLTNDILINKFTKWWIFII